MRIPKQNLAFLLASNALLLVGGEIASAQTPWATAPARPATLPAQSAGTQPEIRSLAPPPVNKPTGSPQISTPAYVPVQRPANTTAAGDQNRAAVSPLLNLPALPNISASGRVQVPPSAAISPPARTGANSLVSYNTLTEQETAPEQLKSGELVAVVGDSHILAGDMAIFVDPIIEKNRDRIKGKAAEEKLRLQLTRQVLKQYVSIKAMYQEFFRDMVGTAPPKEIDDMKKQVVTRANKIFYEKQVPVLLKRHKVHDVASLQQKLAESSSSLEVVRKSFVEQVLSGEFENKYVPREFEVDRNELLEYYRDHSSEWNIPARAKWRQVSILFSEHDRQSALQIINGLFEEIRLGGLPFEAAAKQSSEGFTAEQGGVYDWTRKGSLKSTVLDTAIFRYELRKLSPILEDELGFHIIEVLERENASKRSFVEAQPEIRKILSDQKREKAKEKLRAKVLKRTPVWSLWPEDLKDDIPGVRPLSDALGIWGK